MTDSSRRRGSATAMAVVLLCAGLLAALPTASGAAPIEPRAECVGTSTFPGFLRVEWGYSNPNTVPEDILIGPENFFSPPPASQGQPTHFLSGLHQGIFSTPHLPETVDSIKWNLDGATAKASTSLPQCDPVFLSWRGPWDEQGAYFAGDVVFWDGSSWAADAFVEDEAPGEGEGWELLAAQGEEGQPGAQGESGATGSTGAIGPAGPPGPPPPPAQPAEPGADDDWAGPRSPRFNRRGRSVVRDGHVTPNSVIVIQYADGRRPGRLRPTNLLKVGSGRFVASGEPGTRFRYVVYAPGS